MTPAQIKQLRKALGETQVVFARRFLRAVRSVENWEQGVCSPDPLVVRELERIFNRVKGTFDEQPKRRANGQDRKRGS